MYPALFLLSVLGTLVMAARYFFAIGYTHWRAVAWEQKQRYERCRKRPAKEVWREKLAEIESELESTRRILSTYDEMPNWTFQGFAAFEMCEMNAPENLLEQQLMRSQIRGRLANLESSKEALLRESDSPGVVQFAVLDFLDEKLKRAQSVENFCRRIALCLGSRRARSPAI